MRFWDDQIRKSAAGIALGAVAAYLVAVGVAGAYHESEILAVLALFVLPPAVLFSIYRGSEKRFVFTVSSLVLAGIFFDLAPAIGISRAGLSLILMMIAASAIPLAVDLLVVDMGRQIHVGPTLARMAQLAFVLAVLPLAGVKLFHAHQEIVAEDEMLVAKLAGHLWAEGDSLVVDPLDRKRHTGRQPVTRFGSLVFRFAVRRFQNKLVVQQQELVRSIFSDR